jgi:hypothetical protein
MIELAKDIALDEIALRLAEGRVLCIGRSALDVCLRKRDATLKKRLQMHWSNCAPIC